MLRGEREGDKEGGGEEEGRREGRREEEGWRGPEGVNSCGIPSGY